MDRWLRLRLLTALLWTGRRLRGRGTRAVPPVRGTRLPALETTDGAPPEGRAIRVEQDYLAATTSMVSAAITSLRKRTVAS